MKDIRVRFDVPEESVPEAEFEVEGDMVDPLENVTGLQQLREDVTGINRKAFARLAGQSYDTIRDLEERPLTNVQVRTIRRYVETLGGTLRLEVTLDGQTFYL